MRGRPGHMREKDMSEKILIVDDEKEIADLVALYLESEGFTVFKFYQAADALKCIREENLDLAILDVMLPGASGFQICKKIRESHCYPVIMLTAKGEERDKIAGLTIGADDYITKPFLPLELVARVKAQLRCYKRYNAGTEAQEDVLICGGLVLDEKKHTCILNEKPLSLTPTEFSILSILCRNRGKVVSAEALFRQVWGEEYFCKNSNTVTAHIRHLREKLGDSFENPKYIKTVWGCGYKIEG